MSESPVLGSMNCAADSEDHPRPVLGPAGNLAARSVAELRKPKTKMDHHKPLQQQQQQVKKSPPSLAVTTAPPLHSHSVSAPSILRRQRSHKGLLTSSNLSMNASCSSDASSDSSHSRVSSTGKISSRRNYVRTAATTATAAIRRKQCSSRSGRIENVAAAAAESDTSSDFSADALLVRKRCAWVTPNTDPCYAAFHDEEWGVPVHDDKKLFELLSLSTALAELSWPTILNKRVMFREAFHDFDPMVVSKLNEKKIAAPGSLASSLLSELKLRGFIENARQMCKIIEEFGSFDKYIWGFVNHKPTVSQFRYPRQVPIKTSKADAISKDLVRRGFRGVGPTVIYSFMQVAGLTNDHLVSCFRFQACTAAGDATDNGDEKKAEGKQLLEDANGLGLASVIDDLSLTAE